MVESGICLSEVLMDAAHLTNVSINTALGRMRYALINLRKMIDDNEKVNQNEERVQQR